MSRQGPMKSVCVVGGGLVGWSAAAALKRRLPMLDVSIVAVSPPANALADRLCGTLPSIAGFHEDMGLTEADTVQGAGSAPRIGTEFHHWSAGQSYIHAYEPVGATVGGCSFHLVWLRAAQAGKVVPFDRFSPAVEYVRGEQKPPKPVPFEYGLTIAPDRYGRMMRAFAEHLGVRVIAGQLGEVQVGTDGFVETLNLTDQRQVRADLFVDCTGPEAKVRSALDNAFIDWSKWLPCDRVVFADDLPAQPRLVDRNDAGQNGWTFTASSALQMTKGHIYSSAHGSDQEAAATLKSPTEEPITFRQGRRPEPWRKNVVAVGDAAVCIEPLEWSNLHLAHSAIDRVIAMMPGADCAPVELAEYNRQCGAEADRVRDFVCLHYIAGPTNRGDFWRDAAAIEPPATLAHSLGLFRERGRLPFYEEETFTRDSWLTILLCQGYKPRRIDPLADLVPEAEVRKAVQLDAIRPRQTTPPIAPYNYAPSGLGSQIGR